jgi:hypothetical protein
MGAFLWTGQKADNRLFLMLFRPPALKKLGLGSIFRSSFYVNRCRLPERELVLILNRDYSDVESIGRFEDTLRIKHYRLARLNNEG